MSKAKTPSRKKRERTNRKNEAFDRIAEAARRPTAASAQVCSILSEYSKRAWYDELVMYGRRLLMLNGVNSDHGTTGMPGGPRSRSTTRDITARRFTAGQAPVGELVARQTMVGGAGDDAQALRGRKEPAGR